MPNGVHGRIENHSGTSPAHNSAYGSALLRGIAMDGAILAGSLLLTVFATVEPTAGIIFQPTVFLGHSLQSKMVFAIQFNHLADGRFLAFYSAHFNCCFSVQQSVSQAMCLCGAEVVIITLLLDRCGADCALLDCSQGRSQR